jgi:GH15 family glucan-1,4-alpha-glucosidase
MTRDYPIKDYGIIGNCETAALVNSAGGIDWLCLPAFDTPSFFGALLDREKGGDFSIQPDGDYTVERRYEDDSAIIETRFVTARGTVRLTDFFVIAREQRARFYDFTSLAPTRKLVRLIELEAGDEVRMNMRIAARPDYARGKPQWRPVDRGFACDETAVFASFPLDENGENLGAQLQLQRDHAHFVVLDFADNRTAPDESQVRRWLGITRAFWREWNLFNYYCGPHRDLVRRSAVTLKLLTYAPTGAFVAAPTTSLPEQIGADRNWDYRLTWVRDTALFIDTLFRIGYSGEAKGFFHFIVGECAADELPVLLPIRDGTSVDQEELTHLAGYRGSRPVRRGNRAAKQLQLDNCGHLLQSLLYWRHTGGKLDDAKLRMAATAARGIAPRLA